MTALAVENEVILPRSEYEELIDSLSKCRNKLLELAGECSSCGGTGIITISAQRRGVVVERQTDCDDCFDIRECLR